MIRIFALFTTVLALMTPSLAMAEKLTLAEIQRAWASQGTLTGTFAAKYAAGEVHEGSFTMHGPEQLVLAYTTSQSRVTFGSNGILEEDLYDGKKTFTPDARLEKVFSTNPSFAAYVKTTGDAETHTMLRLTGNEGTIEVFYSNTTARMTHLVVIQNGAVFSTTMFTYD